jgi:small GTP-binding protein
MNRKAKVCMVGATGVGKTSLVARYVSSTFSDVYRTTIGVKVETKRVERAAGTLDMVVWDLSGEDEFQSVQASYLRGASGNLLVIDGTRRETMDVAYGLEGRTKEAVGPVPFVVVLNKVDSVARWEIAPKDIQAMTARGWSIVQASAKRGDGVEEAFERLADAILKTRSWS